MTNWKKRLALVGGGLTVIVAAGVVAMALAAGGDKLTNELSGFQEVPAISSPGSATFEADVAADNQSINWKLSYKDLPDVSQAHIHFAQQGVNGGIATFLCSNLPGPPAGTPACPAPPGNVSGTIDATKIIGPSVQGIGAGELAEFMKALDAGRTYVNVHSAANPGGELRAQIKPDRGPTGPAGAPGPTGAAGAAGAPGARGLRGARGVRGLRGLRGRDARVTCRVTSLRRITCTVRRGR